MQTYTVVNTPLFIDSLADTESHYQTYAKQFTRQPSVVFGLQRETQTNISILKNSKALPDRKLNDLQADRGLNDAEPAQMSAFVDNDQLSSASNQSFTCRPSTQAFMDYKRRTQAKLAALNDNMSSIIRESFSGIDMICNRVRQCLYEMELHQREMLNQQNILEYMPINEEKTEDVEEYEIEAVKDKSIDETDSTIPAKDSTDDFDQDKDLVELESSSKLDTTETDPEVSKDQQKDCKTENCAVEEKPSVEEVLSREEEELLSIYSKSDEENKARIQAIDEAMNRMVDEVHSKIAELVVSDDGEITRIEKGIDTETQTMESANEKNTDKSEEKKKTSTGRQTEPTGMVNKNNQTLLRKRKSSKLFKKRSRSSSLSDVSELPLTASIDLSDLPPDVYRKRALSDINQRLHQQLEANDSYIGFQNLMKRWKMHEAQSAAQCKVEEKPRKKVEEKEHKKVQEVKKTKKMNRQASSKSLGRNKLRGKERRKSNSSVCEPRQVPSKQKTKTKEMLKEQKQAKLEDIARKYQDSLWFSEIRDKFANTPSVRLKRNSSKAKKKTKHTSRTCSEKSFLKKKTWKTSSQKSINSTLGLNSTSLVDGYFNSFGTKSAAVSGCSCNIVVQNERPQNTSGSCRLRWMRSQVLQRSQRSLEVFDILDDLTNKDLAPIKSEYPRKDHIPSLLDSTVTAQETEKGAHKSQVKDTYLYKMMYGDKRGNNRGIKEAWNQLMSQEPSIHCSTDGCASCKSSKVTVTKDETGEKYRSRPLKKKSKSQIPLSKDEVARRLQAYIYDPCAKSFQKPIMTIMPVNVFYNQQRPASLGVRPSFSPTRSDNVAPPMETTSEPKYGEWGQSIICANVSPKQRKVVSDNMRQPTPHPGSARNPAPYTPKKLTPAQQRDRNAMIKRAEWISLTPRGFSTYDQREASPETPRVSTARQSRPTATQPCSPNAQQSPQHSQCKKCKQMTNERKLWANKYGKTTAQKLEQFIEGQPPLPKAFAPVSTMPPRKSKANPPDEATKAKKRTPTPKKTVVSRLSPERKAPKSSEGTPQQNPPTPPIPNAEKQRAVLVQLQGLKFRNDMIQSNIQKAIDVIENKMIDILSAPAATDTSSAEAFDIMEKEITDVLKMMKGDNDTKNKKSAKRKETAVQSDTTSDTSRPAPEEDIDQISEELFKKLQNILEPRQSTDKASRTQTPKRPDTARARGSPKRRPETPKSSSNDERFEITSAVSPRFHCKPPRPASRSGPSSLETTSALDESRTFASDNVQTVSIGDGYNGRKGEKQIVPPKIPIFYDTMFAGDSLYNQAESEVNVYDETIEVKVFKEGFGYICDDIDAIVSQVEENAETLPTHIQGEAKEPTTEILAPTKPTHDKEVRGNIEKQQAVLSDDIGTFSVDFRSESTLEEAETTEIPQTVTIDVPVQDLTAMETQISQNKEMASSTYFTPDFSPRKVDTTSTIGLLSPRSLPEGNSNGLIEQEPTDSTFLAVRDLLEENSSALIDPTWRKIDASSSPRSHSTKSSPRSIGTTSMLGFLSPRSPLQGSSRHSTKSSPRSIGTTSTLGLPSPRSPVQGSSRKNSPRNINTTLTLDLLSPRNLLEDSSAMIVPESEKSATPTSDSSRKTPESPRKGRKLSPKKGSKNKDDAPRSTKSPKRQNENKGVAETQMPAELGTNIKGFGDSPRQKTSPSPKSKKKQKEDPSKDGKQELIKAPTKTEEFPESTLNEELTSQEIDDAANLAEQAVKSFRRVEDARAKSVEKPKVADRKIKELTGQESEPNFSEQVSMVIRKVEHIYSKLDSDHSLGAAPGTRSTEDVSISSEMTEDIAGETFLTPFMQALKDIRRPVENSATASPNRSPRKRVKASKPSYDNIISFLDTLSNLDVDRPVEVNYTMVVNYALLLNQTMTYEQARVYHLVKYLTTNVEKDVFEAPKPSENKPLMTEIAVESKLSDLTEETSSESAESSEETLIKVPVKVFRDSYQCTSPLDILQNSSENIVEVQKDDVKEYASPNTACKKSEDQQKRENIESIDDRPKYNKTLKIYEKLEELEKMLSRTNEEPATHLAPSPRETLKGREKTLEEQTTSEYPRLKTNKPPEETWRNSFRNYDLTVANENRLDFLRDSYKNVAKCEDKSWMLQGKVEYMVQTEVSNQNSTTQTEKDATEETTMTEEPLEKKHGHKNEETNTVDQLSVETEEKKTKEDDGNFEETTNITEGKIEDSTLQVSLVETATLNCSEPISQESQTKLPPVQGQLNTVPQLSTNMKMLKIIFDQGFGKDTGLDIELMQMKLQKRKELRKLKHLTNKVALKQTNRDHATFLKSFYAIMYIFVFTAFTLDYSCV